MKMKLSILCGLVLLAVFAAGAQGQTASTPMPAPAAMPPQGAPPPPPPMSPLDPIGRNLFPPDFIMAHSEDIGLTQEQRTAIRDEVRKAQTQFTEMQWQLEDAVEALSGLLKPSVVDEKAAQSQLEKVLDLERQIKRGQLGLMIRLKNKLNANQQGQLSGFQRNSRGMPTMAPPRKEPPVPEARPME